jgi:hypothetical protein
VLNSSLHHEEQSSSEIQQDHQENSAWIFENLQLCCTKMNKMRANKPVTRASIPADQKYLLDNNFIFINADSDQFEVNSLSYDQQTDLTNVRDRLKEMYPDLTLSPFKGWENLTKSVRTKLSRNEVDKE